MEKTSKRKFCNLLGFLALGLIISVTSCKKNELGTDASEQKSEKTAEQAFLSDMLKIIKLGFDPIGVKVVPGGYLVEGDILLTRHHLDGGIASLSNKRGQYFENTIKLDSATQARTIKVALVSTETIFKQAFAASLIQMNDLKIALNFVAEPDSSRADVVIKVENTNDTDLGSSTFVSTEGNPGRNIKISSSLASDPQAEITGVILHELGHAIGLRHTDYKNRVYSFLLNQNKALTKENYEYSSYDIAYQFINSLNGPGYFESLSQENQVKALEFFSSQLNDEDLLDPDRSAYHAYGTPGIAEFGTAQHADPNSLMLTYASSTRTKFSLYDHIAFFDLYGNREQKELIKTSLGEYGNIKAAGKTLEQIVNQTKALKNNSISLPTSGLVVISLGFRSSAGTPKIK
ncbi:hypothetical protein BWD42_07500 [Sphingobacterium sp. CZ-UAM]|uniref:M57 family metalloprotease n=1 Tax=Sphingobacterium sp. CZ-UAM TaxID=1933868 RepID=UPI000984270D|nr:M57 family metalloprotease [Sphingobacterium sp. CZ-UAM]OOG19738.1 hypothetical protein BWD42_07500 [Sphingobacterium sp. CZ-UAM]